MQAVSGLEIVARCISQAHRDTFSPLPRLQRDSDIVDDQVFVMVPQQTLPRQSAVRTPLEVWRRKDRDTERTDHDHLPQGKAQPRARAR
jgi:hypothetical protein